MRTDPELREPGIFRVSGHHRRDARASTYLAPCRLLHPPRQP
jgi:hypothetical protein